jgi:hypothetical protein
LSPPSTPRYNGAVEAGAGTLKTRVFYQAASRGTADYWTSDDVEGGRLQGNCATWPWGPRDLTPQQHWQVRAAITQQLRENFCRTVAAKALEIRRRNCLEGERLPPRDYAALVRAAVRAAMETHRLLSVHKRLVSPPFNSPLRVKIR